MGAGLRARRTPAALLLAAAPALLAACASGPQVPEGPPPDPTTVAYAPSLDVDPLGMERTDSGVLYQTVAEGSGPTAGRDDRVQIHYILYLPDGTVVDTTVGGEPFTFTMGRDEVIQGWEDGVRGMRVGGRRKLIVPPELGYGRAGLEGVVPPDTPLVFDVQLMAARAAIR